MRDGFEPSHGSGWDCSSEVHGRTDASVIDAPLLLTVGNVADALQVDQCTVWRWISSGKFGPALLRIGRTRRIRAAEFEAWIRAGCPPRVRWEWPQGGRR